MYDLPLVTERVREYLEVRHPELDLANVRVIENPETRGGWMFLIQCSIPAMNDEQLLFEFCRYQCDSDFNGEDCASDLPASMGRGGDYINSPKCRPLLIGDGDDSLAVTVKDHTVTIWLRDLED
jgi:hypothetical protein